MKTIITFILILFISGHQLYAQTSDFLPGYNVVFEDRFDMDPIGDLPAKWSTSGDGQLVKLDETDGKWLKITQPTAVTPNLKKALPENCTIEFDLFLKNTEGVAPFIMFGITSQSNVNAGIYRSKLIATRLYHYNDKQGAVHTIKNYSKLSEKKFALQGYVDRVLHVSISINKTRWRVYLDGEKVTDMPQLLTPEVRKNFFIGSYTIMPDPEEGVYISNVRIAEGEADARSLLIKQLMEQGSVVTSNISFAEQSTEMTQESFPTLDTLGQALVADPNLNIQINGMEQYSGMTEGNSSGMMNEEMVKMKVDRIKTYLVDKFHVNVDRIVTGVSNKIKTKMESAKGSKAGAKIKGFLTEIVKL